jgi:hypothetical protein
VHYDDITWLHVIQETLLHREVSWAYRKYGDNFECTLTVGNHAYECFATTKKGAKNKCAIAAR